MCVFGDELRPNLLTSCCITAMSGIQTHVSHAFAHEWIALWCIALVYNVSKEKHGVKWCFSKGINAVTCVTKYDPWHNVLACEIASYHHEIFPYLSIMIMLIFLVLVMEWKYSTFNNHICVWMPTWKRNIFVEFSPRDGVFPLHSTKSTWWLPPLMH